VPSTLAEHQVRIVPLGGLGEIGMNCMAIEQSDGILVVDCGTSFPFDDLGVDVIHPAFDWLIANADRISGVFLTHGHEDHIGALPYLLDEIDAPVWGGPHALGLAWRRLEEHAFTRAEIRFHEVTAGSITRVGPFEVEPIRVSHSIVEATALRIATRAGTLLHTGDFNMDPDPPDGEPTNVARLEAVGDMGVDLLLSDSTNIDVPERRGSEREVGEALDRLVDEAGGRIFIALFASNIQRLKLLGEIAKKKEKKLCLLGRSLLTQHEVATRIGRLGWPSNLLVSPEGARELPKEEVLVLCGGSQAEPNSALMKLAHGTHPLLAIDAGDSVIFSARVIPGNDRAVFTMMGDLLRRGAKLYTRATHPDVHTSGHAGRSEQQRMIELARPRAFLPLHGTRHHLERHAELARELGVSQVMVIENGQAVRFDKNAGLERDGEVTHGKVAIAHGGEPLAPDILRRRAELGRNGLVTVTLVLDDHDLPLSPPSLRANGVPGLEDEVSLRSAARAIALGLEENRGIPIEDEARRALRRRLSDTSRARPIIEVQVVRVGR
jgi:ribonuclease J